MRVRVEYEKGPSLKYLSHLDLVRAWERILRRTGLKLQLSEGFNPHLKLSLGTVLPVGIWGEKEYLDFVLDDTVTLDEIKAKLSQQSPPGIVVKVVGEIPVGLPSLMASVNAAAYKLLIKPSSVNYPALVEELSGQEHILVTQERKNREVDLKPGLYSLKVLSDRDTLIIEAWLAAGSQTPVRMVDLLEVLISNGLPREDVIDLYRAGNYVKQGEVFRSPLALE